MTARDDLYAAEDAAIAKLQAAIVVDQRGVISASLLAASKAALTYAQKLTGADTIDTAVVEFRRLRLDPAVQRALDSDCLAAADYLSTALPAWLTAGWLMQAHGQQVIMREEGAKIAIEVELTDADTRELAEYPVMGFASTENTRWLTQCLRRDIQGAMSLCLATTAADAVLGALADIQRLHVGRLQQQCRQNFLAGAGAARAALQRALVGVG